MRTVEETAEALRVHRSKSFVRRLGARAVSVAYPTKYERRELHRHEIGPWGRATEDLLKAFVWTKKLNNTPRAILGGQWRVANEFGSGRNATLPLEIGPDSAFRPALDRTFAAAGHREQTYYDAVGFFLPTEKRILIDRDVEESGIGVMLLNDYNTVDAVVFKKDEFSDLSRVDQESLSSLVERVEEHCFYTYDDARPEFVP